MQIKNLTLYTSRLNEMTAFYSEVLGFEKIDSNERSSTIQIGKSILQFLEKAETTPYHFAFNIPSNQENEALAWLKERADILRNGPYEIQDFEDWNAKAIYFYDPDKNIVEFIARKNLEEVSHKAFDVSSVLEISEIGMPVDDISKAYSKLNEIVRLPQYDGGMDRFCAIGDERGLFICINKHVKDWFPTNDKAFSSPFILSIEHDKKPFDITFSQGELT